MKRFVLICALSGLVLLSAGCASSPTRRALESNEAGEVFRLEMHRYFSPPTRFTLVRWFESKRQALLVEWEVGANGKYQNERLVELSEEQVDLLDKALTRALRTDMTDAVEGLDGSIWCLETQRMHTSVEVCLWSPDYESDERGLSDFSQFGKTVWALAKAQEQFGDI